MSRNKCAFAIPSDLDLSYKYAEDIGGFIGSIQYRR